MIRRRSEFLCGRRTVVWLYRADYLRRTLRVVSIQMSCKGTRWMGRLPIVNSWQLFKHVGDEVLMNLIDGLKILLGLDEAEPL